MLQIKIESSPYACTDELFNRRSLALFNLFLMMQAIEAQKHPRDIADKQVDITESKRKYTRYLLHLTQIVHNI